jgi:hypothetical protein
MTTETIRRYVLNKTIPYKIQKAVCFRLSEIETWIDGGGMFGKTGGTGVPAGDLFGEAEPLPERGRRKARNSRRRKRSWKGPLLKRGFGILP